MATTQDQVSEQKDSSHIDTNQKLGVIQVKSVIPKSREELLKWNGWGYKDSNFDYIDETNTIIQFTGNRYPICGKNLPHMKKFVKDMFNVDLTNPKLSQPQPTENQIPKSNITDDDLLKLSKLGIEYSIKGIDRLVRSHGQNLNDIYVLRTGMFDRIPDIVMWPKCHKDVVKLVQVANENNFVIIPIGGATGVTGGVECSKNEIRTIISLDTTQMNRILWVDKENLSACCEAGIVGQDLERELKNVGFMTGHEPDSCEFSTLGGWVATRASGMKKNVYGNIEDLLVHVKVVTAKGVLEKNCQAPRLSSGPDFHHIVMGSEGTLGVITEVVIKIRPIPESIIYGSVLFPDFESGVKCMREIALRRSWPASMRLMDNDQFKFGLTVKTESTVFETIVEKAKKFFITAIKRFDLDTLCLMTLVFEGEKKYVKVQEKHVYEIAATYYGYPTGAANGERGYMLTYSIAYIRDMAFEYKIVAESFETSVSWDRAVYLCRNVKRRVAQECKKIGVDYHLMSCRVTQIYDSGCVIYFYLAFEYTRFENPVLTHHQVEDAARDEIVACGGSISHHHGVGKIRKKWYPETVSAVGVDLYRATKNELDPKNIFATNNFLNAKL